MAGIVQSQRGRARQRRRGRRGFLAAAVAVAVLSSITTAGAAAPWTLVPGVSLGSATESTFWAAACPSSTRCFAVGHTGTGEKTLVERWTGSSWAKQTSPTPSGALSTDLYGVSCVSASSCMAVGTYTNSSGDGKTLALRWNGTSWAKVTTPNPTGTTDAQLFAVSCSSTTPCRAVGTYKSGSDFKTLAQKWNGSTWTTVSSPNPSGSDDSELFSIACTSSTSCRSVGFGHVGGVWKTLAEKWNGTSWAKVTSPNPSTTDNELFAVACASATNCQAVGGYESGGVFKTLVEKWNGSSWATVSSPNPASATSSTLNGIVCRTTVGCFAVGTYFNGTIDKTLIEHRS
ncbi:MAG TPA: hypothetical protein VL856_16920 [Acidimicrobiia bacterium]|nr:hypothetical protein [Acidimicrobiia bacterium]